VYRAGHAAQEGRVDCDTDLRIELDRFDDPTRRAKEQTGREVARGRAYTRARHEASRRAWEAGRGERVVRKYADAQAPDAIPEAGVREEAVALAMLRYAPEAGVLAPLSKWSMPLSAPRTRTGPELVV